MGGKITYNENYRSGAEFIIEFPIELLGKNYKEQTKTENTSTQINMGNSKILVAEDDQTNQYLIRNILSKIGVSFDMVSNGLEAINKSLHEKYNIILMDINMPTMDGIQASEIILHHPKIAKKPYIIAVTADAFQEDRERCKEAGMVEFLAKPYQKKQIEDIILKYIQ